MYDPAARVLSPFCTNTMPPAARSALLQVEPNDVQMADRSGLRQVPRASPPARNGWQSPAMLRANFERAGDINGARWRGLERFHFRCSGIRSV